MLKINAAVSARPPHQSRNVYGLWYKTLPADNSRPFAFIRIHSRFKNHISDKFLAVTKSRRFVAEAFPELGVVEEYVEEAVQDAGVVEGF